MHSNGNDVAILTSTGFLKLQIYELQVGLTKDDVIHKTGST